MKHVIKFKSLLDYSREDIYSPGVSPGWACSALVRLISK